MWKDGTAMASSSATSGWDVTAQQQEPFSCGCRDGDNGGSPPPSSDSSRRRWGDQESGEVDHSIASALQGMSLQDRDKLYSEIHGVVDLVDETPELIRESFARLQQELLRIAHVAPQHSSGRMDATSFRIAEQRDYAYVHSRFHYLMVLRCEKFDIPKAAVRLVYFFQIKGLLFGQKNLCIDINQGMLSKKEIELLKSGFLQILNTRDQSGRVVLAHFFHMIRYDTPEDLARVYLYTSWICALDEESQKKGSVMIQWNLKGTSGEEQNKKQPMNFAFIQLQVLLTNGCPIRTGAFHNHLSDQLFLVLKWGFKLIPKETQARVKLHTGTPQEFTYTLMAYGIPPDVHPVSPEGEVRTRRHREFVKACATIDCLIEEGQLHAGTADVPVRAVVIVPASNDVLLGRGRRSMIHPGNVLLNRLVDESMAEYVAGHKSVKTAITHRLIGEIKEQYKGRFLEQEPPSGVWRIATDDTVRLRISQRFRARKNGEADEPDVNSGFSTPSPKATKSLPRPAHKRHKTGPS